MMGIGGIAMGTLAAMLKDIETDELIALIQYLERQIRKAGVTVKLNAEVTPALIAAWLPHYFFQPRNSHFHPSDTLFQLLWLAIAETVNQSMLAL